MPVSPIEYTQMDITAFMLAENIGDLPQSPNSQATLDSWMQNVHILEDYGLIPEKWKQAEETEAEKELKWLRDELDSETNGDHDEDSGERRTQI
jgi:hypothetical protein